MPCIFPHVARISFSTLRASEAGTGDTHESGTVGDTAEAVGEAVLWGCLTSRLRVLALDVRGGCGGAGDMLDGIVDGWPIEVTTDSSRL
jgi:hypothetical protein